VLVHAPFFVAAARLPFAARRYADFLKVVTRSEPAPTSPRHPPKVVTCSAFVEKLIALRAAKSQLRNYEASSKRQTDGQRF